MYQQELEAITEEKYTSERCCILSNNLTRCVHRHRTFLQEEYGLSCSTNFYFSFPSVIFCCGFFNGHISTTTTSLVCLTKTGQQKPKILQKLKKQFIVRHSIVVLRGTGVRQLMRGLATFAQSDQDPLVVTARMEEPSSLR